MVDHYFWIDLAFGTAVACLMTALYAGAAAPVRRLLSSGIALRIGLFSYSIYLLHGPLVSLLDQHLVAPLHVGALARFGLLLAVGIPAILVVCYLFHRCFEAPFLHRRDAGALRDIPFVRALRPRPGMQPPVGEVATVVEPL
jgi:peptidoglycan/LPS O-acetylase OafA/YrhL